MTEIDFYELSRAVQDSLLDSLRGAFAPRPIAIRGGARRSVAVWLAVAAGAALLLACLSFAGFGDVSSRLSLHPTWVIALDAALAATSAIATLSAFACRARTAELPFPPAVFVFPANLIDARAHRLRVYPLEELTSVAPSADGTVVLTFGRARFSFPVTEGESAEELVARVEAARDRMQAPLDDEERRQLDPLAVPAVASPLGLDTARTRTAPQWERLRFALGAAIGVVLGASVFFGRNAASDARMLAWAQAHDDVASYQGYLARGQRSRDTVSRTLLPRAALRTAVAAGSVEAIDAFIRDYPDTGIQAEIDAARRAALVAELERARVAATFEALFSFAERYPEQARGPAFEQAKHALYARALARHRKELADAVVDVVGRLFASSERQGPRKTEGGLRGPVVWVRFRRLPSKEMGRAADMVSKSPMFNGPSSLPATYLGPDRFTPHEKAGADALAAGLARAFDPEIAALEPGPPLDAAEGDLPPLPEPTLVVSYRVEPSGAAYAAKKPRGIFLGLLFYFTAELVLPADTRPLKTKLTLSERIPIDALRRETPEKAGALETVAYEEMTRAAFAEVRERYLATWFKKSPPPPPPQ